MRTTVNIEDRALELCRKQAAETGRSLGDVISEAILQAFSTRSASPRKQRYELPVWTGGELQPSVNLDKWAEVEDIMDGLR